MSALGRQALKSKLGGLPPMPPANVGRGASKRQLIRKRDYTPVHWDVYFQSKHDIAVGENIFRVYESGTEGPVLLFIHGGGFSALSWSLVSSTVSQLVTCRCAAVDVRGHGDSQTNDDTDLTAQTLSSDIGEIVKALYGDDPPPIILVGHSMGGAIAVHTAQRNLIGSLIGLVVIDVVEGTAMDALSSMQSFLRGRPTVFKSLEHAIEWCVRSGQIRNLDSAKVSMVGQLKRVDNQETATSEMDHVGSTSAQDTIIEETSSNVQETIAEETSSNMQDSIAEETSSNMQDSIAEETLPDVQDTIVEEEEEGGSENSHHSNDSNHFKAPSLHEHSDTLYTWRIDLAKTEKFWRGWFEGLSQRFLSCEVPKMLLLAGVDRLDKDLTIGQMQGKFQMQVLPQSGHAVHEDVPDKVADVLATFMVRYKVAEATINFQRSFPAC